MESDRTSTSRSDSVSDSQPKARLLQGRTYGPSRRSTKGQWTPEEDEILREAVQHFKGKKWKKIAQCFKDRTDVQCLHRWQKVLNPELVKGPWSKEEDDAIVELVKKQGPTKWSTIAQHLPGRIGKQCRERWHNHLNPNINKEAWTQEEELALIRAHQIYGNNWAELTKYLPGRSHNAIKNHWNSSVKKKLDSYMASGLLAQFRDLPNPIHTIQNVATCSKTPQISEEDRFARNGQPETEEVSLCSQGSAVVGFSQSTSDARNTTTNMPTGEVYLEYNLPVEWGGSMENDWRQLNQNNLPENPMSGQLIRSLSAQFHHLSTHFPFHSSGNMTLATDESGCHFAPAEEGGKIIGLFPFQSGTMDGSAESLHYQSSTYQFPMDGTSTSTLQPCFSSFCQSFPDPSQPMSDPGSLIYGVSPIFFNDSTGLSEQNALLERNDSFINTNDAYQEDNAGMTEQLDQGLDTSRVTTVNGIGMESNKFNLRFIIDNKLDETNFLDCERNLKIILRHENISYVLDTPLCKDPKDASNEESVKKHAKHCSDSVEATCIILASMTPELQKQHESMDAYTIMTHLKELYASQSRTERYEVSKALFGCKMAPGSSVGSHVLKMIGHIERLEKLGHKMERELSIDLILQSLPDSYSHFVMNYHMNKIDSSLAELLNMLKTAEGTVGKGKQVLLVTSSKGKEKAQKKSKKVKEAVKPKPMIAKDKSKDACFHCSQPGHWGRNCKAFLNTKKNKHSDASTLGTKKD